MSDNTTEPESRDEDALAAILDDLLGIDKIRGAA
jgi:hypothetical protein